MRNQYLSPIAAPSQPCSRIAASAQKASFITRAINISEYCIQDGRYSHRRVGGRRSAGSPPGVASGGRQRGSLAGGRPGAPPGSAAHQRATGGPRQTRRGAGIPDAPLRQFCRRLRSGARRGDVGAARAPEWVLVRSGQTELQLVQSGEVTRRWPDSGPRRRRRR